MLGEGLQLTMLDYALLWSAAIASVLGTGIRIALGIKYSRLIDEVDKMTTTKNRDLKRCKIKYEKCHAMNQGVANVGAFVDRFMSKLSMGPFTCLALYQMGAQLILLSVILMAVAICHRILEGDSLLKLLPYYAACFAGIYVFLTITVVVNIHEKKNVLKISLVDYLENHLTARLESVGPNMAKIQGIAPTATGAAKPSASASAVRAAAVAKTEEATKPLPKVPRAEKSKIAEQIPQAEHMKQTEPDYGELTKLLEDFFAV